MHQIGCDSISEKTCPIETTLKVIGGKWKPLILYHLWDGAKRFNQLKRLMPNVSRHMLTQHLRELQADGIVHREVYAEVPPRVEYSLTETGEMIRPLLQTMHEWGEWYREQTTDKDIAEAGD